MEELEERRLLPVPEAAPPVLWDEEEEPADEEEGAVLVRDSLLVDRDLLEPEFTER